jgi:hypothetical protein
MEGFFSMKLPDFEGGGTQDGRDDQRSPPRLVDVGPPSWRTQILRWSNQARLAERDRVNVFLMLAVRVLSIAGGLFLAVCLADFVLE